MARSFVICQTSVNILGHHLPVQHQLVVLSLGSNQTTYILKKEKIRFDALQGSYSLVKQCKEKGLSERVTAHADY